MKKLYMKKVTRTIKTGFDTFKFYLRKPASVIFLSAYAVIALFALCTIGFSKLINSKPSNTDIPSLPENSDFNFLPADNLEVPILGETNSETAEEETPAEPELSKPAEEPTPEPSSYSAPATVYTPVIIEKEVIKEVPKEVIKEVPKEVPVKIDETTPEQINYDNYRAPELEPLKSPEETNSPSEESDTANN